LLKYIFFNPYPSFAVCDFKRCARDALTGPIDRLSTLKTRPTETLKPAQVDITTLAVVLNSILGPRHIFRIITLGGWRLATGDWAQSKERLEGNCFFLKINW
uniref:Uncharacterized protein n=1 Tax=Aegilops tauschii subsp. strangulata TaxID=200361 RepID=A0A453B008_AEGTS